MDANSSSLHGKSFFNDPETVYHQNTVSNTDKKIMLATVLTNRELKIIYVANIQCAEANEVTLSPGQQN